MNSLNNTATCLSVIVGPTLGHHDDHPPTQCVFSILALCVLPAIWLVWRTPETKCPSCDEGTGEVRRPSLGHRRGYQDPSPMTSCGCSFHRLFGILLLWRLRLARVSLLPRLSPGGNRVDGLALGVCRRGLHAGVALHPEGALKELSMKLLPRFCCSRAWDPWCTRVRPSCLRRCGQVLTGLGFGAMGPVRSTLTGALRPQLRGSRDVGHARGPQQRGRAAASGAPFLANALACSPCSLGVDAHRRDLGRSSSPTRRRGACSDGPSRLGGREWLRHFGSQCAS